MKVGWDVPLSDVIQSQWRLFYYELQRIQEIRIPRWLEVTSVSEMQIHVYCDASAKAYGTVIYVRVRQREQWKAKLLCSRSRVAPVKPVTIPRLELCGVELGCKLLTRVQGIHQFSNTPVFLWTDSEIVLYWLRKPPGTLKVFVNNRVSRILKKIWKW